MEESNLSENDQQLSVSQEKAKKVWSFVEKNFLALSIVVAGVMISSSLLYTNGGGLDLKAGGAQIGDQGAKVNVSVDDDPFLGDKNAKVTVIEFSDYQCPFCRTFWK